MHWDSHHLHWGWTEHHHWFARHRHLHSNPNSAWGGGAYVGRTGTLAVALGIGTAAVTGSCWACATANADIGERGSSSGGSNTSTSQSVEARRGPRTTASSVAADSLRAPRGANHRTARATSGARSTDNSDRLSVATEVHINVPDAAMAPSPAPAAAPLVIGDLDVSVAAEQVPAPASHPSAAPNAMPKAFQPAAMPLRPAVVVASPAAASPAFATTFTNVFTALSTALRGGDAPTVPADASLALALGAARRENSAVLRSAAAKSTKTTVVAATATTTTTTTTAEAEKMARSGSTRVVSDNKASGRSAIALVGSGSVSTTVTIPASTALTIRARTSSGAPNMTVSIDGVPITTVVVSSTSYSDYTFAGSIPAGTHAITVSSSSATSTSTLYLDKVSTTTGAIGDQFNGKSGAAPNSTMWTRTTGTGWDIGIQDYVSGGAYLDGQGNLVIQSTKTASGGYTSGRVQTANKMSFGYGTITARIKVPKGQALWPAFWLIGADEATNGWPGVGEIDVMELPGTTTTMYSTLHGPIAGSTATQQAQIISTLPDLSDDYHNYWVRHLEDEITFGVDNQTLGTLTPADLAPGETWVYNRPMSMIINLAVGGTWAGAPDSTTPSTAKMLVDSVTFAPA